MKIDLGPVRRWKDGDGVYYAANEFVTLAWAVTDDAAMVGKMGWYGPQKICVEYINQETANRVDAELDK